MKIDVVVIAHNSENNIENLLFSLVKQSDLVDVLLVDNNCRPKEKDKLKFYSKKYNFKLLINKFYNLKTAKTIGFENCKNDYVCFLSGNDSIPDDYFKTLLSDNFTENYQVIFPGNYNSDYIYEDLLNGSVDYSIFGKVFKRTLFTGMKFTQSEDFENFYKFSEDTKIHSVKNTGYVHNPTEKYQKEFDKEYKYFSFFYEQYKYFGTNAIADYLSIVISQMIKYGNDAYAKMIIDKNSYKTELNNIKSAYIFLKNDFGAKYNKRIFNKIKNGKFTESDVATKRFTIIKKIKEKFKKFAEKFSKKRKNDDLLYNKDRKVKKRKRFR